MNRERKENGHFEILSAIEEESAVTQRMLARRLGVALGTANKLVRSLLGEKLIELSADGKSKTKYLLTPQGKLEKSRLQRKREEETIARYEEIRNRIAGRLDELAPEARRIILYGVNTLAEITFLAASQTRRVLVGVVDEEKKGDRFVDHVVEDPAELGEERLNGAPYDAVVVTSPSKALEIRKTLLEKKIAPSRILVL